LASLGALLICSQITSKAIGSAGHHTGNANSPADINEFYNFLQNVYSSRNADAAATHKRKFGWEFKGFNDHDILNTYG